MNMILNISMNTNTNFETMVINQQFVDSMIIQTTKYIFLFFVILLFMKKFIFKDSKLMHIFKMIVLMFKFAICGLAVFFVFFFNFETKKISFFHAENMLFSTFLVGALALYELFSILADLLDDDRGNN